MKAEQLYKADTGRSPVYGIEIETFRSKGRWILDMTDEKIIKLIDLLQKVPDPDYLEWLENRVEDINNR